MNQPLATKAGTRHWLTLCLLLVAPFTAEAERYSAEANLHYQSYREDGILLDFAGAHPGATREDALAFQAAYTEQFLADGDMLVGYKLGFTGKTGPSGATPPLAGRLFASQRMEAGGAFDLADLGNPILEVELAFRFKRDVPPGANAAAIRDAVDTVAGCIEVPNPHYLEQPHFHGLNFIAHNVVARRYMIFDWVPLTEVGDVNKVVALLTRPDGRQVIFQSGNVLPEAGNHHWSALEFAVEELARAGATIHAGQFVITGSMGYALSAGTDDTGATPAETLHIMVPGQYAIDYGPRLGRHVFHVKPETDAP